MKSKPLLVSVHHHIMVSRGLISHFSASDNLTDDPNNFGQSLKTIMPYYLSHAFHSAVALGIISVSDIYFTLTETDTV